MKIDIQKAYTKPEWFPMDKNDKDGPKFKIRPFPASKESYNISGAGDLVLTGKNQLNKFVYCLMEWKNVEDAKGVSIAISDEIKRIVFEAQLGGISKFVLMKVAEMDVARSADTKN